MGRTKGRLRFRLGFVFLLVTVVGMVSWFAVPAIHISHGTCARIQPGMAEEEVYEIVGAPPGYYDGVRGISSNAPFYKWHEAEIWVGLHGKLVVELDGSRRVTQATFYSGRVVNWSLGGFLWERFTKVRYMGLSAIGRTILHLLSSALAVLVLGVIAIRPDSENRVALHGLAGLFVGAVLSFAIFPDGFVADLLLVSLGLSGPILGAASGLAVGLVRKILERKPSTEFCGAARGI